MRARDIPAKERLLAKLKPQPNGCWHWTGVVDKAGYGRVGYQGRRSTPLQQAVYLEMVGPIPDGHEIDHACHNADDTCPGGPACLHRRCGNPAHLRPLVRVENSRLAKSRVKSCPQGHLYDKANTYTNGGRRFCRECMRERGRAYKSRKKATA